MKVLQKWRLFGALTAVAALIASATAFANAPNTDVVGTSDDSTTVAMATALDNTRTTIDIDIVVCVGTTGNANGYSEGGALAGDWLSTTVTAEFNTAMGTIERKAAANATTTNAGEAYDATFPANTVVNASGHDNTVTEGGALTGAWLATASTTGAFSGSA